MIYLIIWLILGLIGYFILLKSYIILRGKRDVDKVKLSLLMLSILSGPVIILIGIPQMLEIRANKLDKKI